MCSPCLGVLDLRGNAAYRVTRGSGVVPANVCSNQRIPMIWLDQNDSFVHSKGGETINGGCVIVSAIADAASAS